MINKKFEWLKLFPISYYRWNKDHDFNAFIFYLDILLYAIPLSMLLSYIIINLIS